MISKDEKIPALTEISRPKHFRRRRSELPRVHNKAQSRFMLLKAWYRSVLLGFKVYLGFWYTLAMVLCIQTVQKFTFMIENHGIS